MEPSISFITLGVADLERSVAFYRDGLGLSTQGIIGTEFEKTGRWRSSRCVAGCVWRCGHAAASPRTRAQQPVVGVPLHSTGDATALTALLLPQILPVFSVVAPGQPGASPVSVPRGTSTTGC